MNNCESPLPENIINIIECLNRIEGFKSPQPDFCEYDPDKTKGLNNLEEGTKILIKLADTAHDFNFFEFNFINEAGLKTNGLLTRSTMEVLQYWIHVRIEEELGKILPQDENSCIDIAELISCICTSPENFVYYYLYWHDNFNVVNSCDIGGGNFMEYEKTIIKTIIFSNLDCGGSSHMPLFRNTSLSNYNERYRDFDYANNNKKIIKIIASNLRKLKDYPAQYELDGNYFSVDQGASYDIIKHNDDDIKHFVIHSYAKIYDQPIGGGPSDSDTILRNILINNKKPIPNDYILDVITENFESTFLINQMRLSDDYIYIDYNGKHYIIPYDFPNRAKIKNAAQCFMAYVHPGAECGPLLDAANVEHNIKNLINIINSVCSKLLERESIINDNGTFNIKGEETIHELTMKIISILTDLKRNGDYLQVKEIKYVDLYNINNIIHITHDRISGYISHKIFGNYTMFVKNNKNGTCQLYLLMIPQNTHNLNILKLQHNINNDIYTSCTKTSIIRESHDIINHNINRDAFYNFLNTGCIYDNYGIKHYPNYRNNIWTFGGSDKTTTKTTSNSPSYNNIRLIDSLNIIMNKENEFIILINNNIYNNANSYNNTLKLKNNVLSKSNNENLLKIMYLFKVFNNKDLFNYDINNIEILSHNNTELKNKTKTELRHDENKTIKNLDMCCDMLLHTLTSIQKLIIIDIKNIIIIINKFIRKNIRLINKKQENPILNNHLLAILQIAVLFVVKKEEDNENINNELINKEDNTKLKRENIFE